VLIPGAGVFVEADIAALIARLLGDWSGQNLRLGLARDPDTYARLAETIAELYQAGASGTGNSEGQRKSDAASSEEMLTATKLGNAVGLTARRIGQLRDEGKVEGIPSSRGYLYPATQVERIRQLRKEAA
jgi:hypothetical protein